MTLATDTPRSLIIADLVARIAEDVAVARSAWHDDGERSGQWRVEPYSDPRGDECDVVEDRAGDYWGNPRHHYQWSVALEAGRATGQHMARHDPARVLAESEVKLRLLAECTSDPTLADRILPLLAGMLPEKLERECSEASDAGCDD